MIKEMVRNLVALDKYIWGMYSFNREPIGRKIPKADKLKMIEEANQCGIEEAQKLREKYGAKSVREYAALLGATISDIENGDSTDYILFAKFNSPDKIAVSSANVKKAEDMTEKEELRELIDNVSIEDVLLAHEMFHLIEDSDKEIYTRITKIKLWNLGPFKYHSGIITLGEIAAMAFAKELLKLSFYPNIFDVLLLYPHDEKRAKLLYDEVIAMKGTDENA